MAIVHKYTIIYLILIVHKTMSISIKRNLCLETFIRFLNSEDKCNFNLETASGILRDVTTCPTKCNFEMYDLYYGSRYSLGRSYLTIGNKEAVINSCSESRQEDKYLYITCSSWIARNLKLNESCELTEECIQSLSVCLDGKCKCVNGYSAFDSKSCLKDNVPVGGFCSLHEQCTGSNNSGVCEKGRCTCTKGFTLIDLACETGNLTLNDSCELTEQCIQPFSVCLDGKCQCLNGFSAFDTDGCLKDNVPVGGFCSFDKQCTGSNNSGVCENGRCTCTKGFTLIDFACEKGNLTLNDSCELTEQCIQPFSVCLDRKCQCLNGFSAFDTDGCLKDPVPVGGFCSLHKQCTGSNNSGVCENGRCTCTEGFKFVDSSCEKNHQNSLGSLNSQQHGTNIGITHGTLFGGFILGVIVTAVVATLMYRRLKCRTPNRKEPDVMFVENRENGTADGTQISFTNNKKQNIATLSPYSFAKETQGYNLSSKQEDERTDDVYNHLHEQTEQDDDNYDHACAVPNHSSDLSDYSNIHDATKFRTSPSKEGDDYSTLRN